MTEQNASASRVPLGWQRLFVEPARPDWVRRRRRAPWLVVATVCIGAFMGQLDASIVTLAVPPITTELHASLGEVEWVALVYLLVLVGTISAVGRLADMLGRKLFYTYGFVLFTLASLACGLAPDLPWLIAARAVQAVGAAMLQSNSVALIRTSMPPGRLGRAIGLQGAAQALGLAIGPSVGGLLIAAGGWRWVFFVNVPAGILGAALGWIMLPRTRAKAPLAPLDLMGLALLLPAVGSLLLALSEASRRGFADAQVMGLAALAVAFGAAFVWRERRAKHPLVDLGLFRSGRFSAGLGAGAASFLALFGVLLVTPLYTHARLGLGPTQSGLLLTILPVALALVAPTAGRLADRRGPRLPMTFGMVLAAAGLAGMAAGAESVVVLAVSLAAVGAGLGFFTPANNASVAAAGHDHQAGMVSGVLNMTRGIGTSLGVAVGAVTYALASAGSGSSPEGSEAGFRTALIVFAAVALGGAALSAARRRR
ncbi:MFS transporter [Sinomonas albida]|uniref:MFS transporter n=1 Tax=Sinomonas albida TaxID=369942 RepID=UPI00301834E9